MFSYVSLLRIASAEWDLEDAALDDENLWLVPAIYQTLD